MISLKDVRKKYGVDTEIGPLDIEIPRGGITALIGPNGAGKSTMLTMVGRLLELDGGTISVGGHDVQRTKSSDLAKVVSILRQENHFITKLTVRQLVGFGRFPYSRGRLTAADEEIISRYISFLNLGELQHRYLDELSGGQRQRAYVAMVLSQETDYVLLDEPLNNLDIAHSVQMMKHLKTAAQEFGRTIVVVLHDINFAARYADYVCMMKQGKVQQFGSVPEVMSDEILTEVFETPITVITTDDGLMACYH
ncbi:ATP-binding cassette domain-containing protein [Corynebacterium poyangense]|uniref:ATP-binding cassette domain-containing protein n=1 Tax=Corynebacterium poyangense TaxID=2684405 RepID=A0A7H0SMQ8_9CORY|nr:ATP-binding cassette domain-containing protein [Corynebacterium poyangense]MBZ8176942.1 ATP-binding cassette domain-containing protein [Corynebacterium poyangense]QNQ89833.1 ATP-binding cassette domain-containing protein [Corynebacterium poyangense]